ncbi:Protein kinase, ATP binding site-containing protein [Artemisia annua]|uniref:Protein kinase, ATP binding site-containing protein n=1 Tax=Artemisia annua TaxID=35608 RepID=A0A2U1N8M4_ARTAN|nr:Protein kinase, ATP binding site-containing protein [Artemisia annua]
MDGTGREVNLNNNNPNTSSSSSSFNSSPPDFLRNVHAAFKRHRKMPITNMQPRRLVVPRRETVRSTGAMMDSKTDEYDDSLVKQRVQDISGAVTKNMASVAVVNHETASITPPSIMNTPTEDGNFMGVDDRRGEGGLGCDCRSNNMFAQPCLKCRQVADGLKKVQFALGNSTGSHGSDDHMDTRTTNILTHMGSLALTEMERDVNNRVDVSAAPSHDANEQNVCNMDVDISSRSNNEISSLLAKGTAGVQKHVSPLRNFLQSDFGHQITSSSVVGSTCATTTLVNSANAPMVSSTSHCSRPSQQGSFNAGNSFDMNYHRMTQIDTGNPPKFSSKVLADQNPSAAVDSYPENKHELPRDQQGNEAGLCGMPKDPPPLADNSQPPISNDQISNVKSVTSKSGKSEKPASKKDPSAPRKRSYDPDLFFKVNGKLYQRLGKIGSGGSSEVHKVISQDCTIYALKKIKLKGRDYATAYGFCQEIEYLNKLKGKDHIIQLIDYEVTDKALLKEVLSGSMSIKDGRVKDDGCIYMVLEYGEIDLAHMLSQKWRELDDSRSTIDENWLRFYWQQSSSNSFFFCSVRTVPYNCIKPTIVSGEDPNKILFLFSGFGQVQDYSPLWSLLYLLMKLMYNLVVLMMLIHVTFKLKHARSNVCQQGVVFLIALFSGCVKRIKAFINPICYTFYKV